MMQGAGLKGSGGSSPGSEVLDYSLRSRLGAVIVVVNQAAVEICTLQSRFVVVVSVFLYRGLFQPLLLTSLLPS